MSGSEDNASADRLFASRRQHLVDFAFDDAVAAVFPDMIRRSVPGYETVVPLTGLIAARHLAAGGRCYDLGCSLGAATQALLATVGERACEIVAVDQSEPMLARAQAMAGEEPRVEWLHADIRELDLQPADVVILNYALQFLPPADRLPLLVKIRRCLTSNGVLVLSEKLLADDYFETLHLDFKRANGYSELEIAQKRTALENVMRIDDAETHLQRLRKAGFADARLWFRCLNWGSFVAEPSAGEREGLAPRMQKTSAGEREGLAPRMQTSAREREGLVAPTEEPRDGAVHLP